MKGGHKGGWRGTERGMEGDRKGVGGGWRGTERGIEGGQKMGLKKRTYKGLKWDRNRVGRGTERR